MTNPGNPQHGGVELTYTRALQSWRDHQPDRAWLEFGFQWPPLTIARPRCSTHGCRLPWPCPAARAADGWLSRHEASRATAPAPAR